MKKTISVRNIDSEAWCQFRSLCLVNGKTVSEKLNELLLKSISEYHIEPESEVKNEKSI